MNTAQAWQGVKSAASSIKQAISMRSLYARLRGLVQRGWKARVDAAGCIRLASPDNPKDFSYCPLTAISLDRTGKKFSIGQYEDAALAFGGINPNEPVGNEHVVKAADYTTNRLWDFKGTPLFDLAIRVRGCMLRALGLKEATV